MGSLTSLMFLAQGGMAAQSAGIQIAGQNITNASTPGYVRRSALLEARPMGGGALGGVEYTGIQRHYDKYAQTRILGESGMLASATARAGGLAGLEAWLAPTEGGIGDSMTAMFSAATELASNAADPAARSAFLARAEQVAQSFRSAGDALAARRGELHAQAGETAGQVNAGLQDIAKLNQQIATAQASGEPAADLRDKRDQIVRSVSEKTGASMIEEPNGMVTLLAGGTALVQGDQASKLSVSLGGAGELAFSVQKPGGSTIDVTSRLDGGTLGGIKEARDVDLTAMQTSLDQMAFDFASAANAVHGAGYGLDGVSGRPLFKPPAGVAGAARALVVDPGIAGQPNKIGASSTATGLPAGNSAALALAGLASQPLAGGGTPAERFGSFAASLGSAQTSAASAMDMRESTLGMAEAMREQSAGVSIDEEMVNLSRYQRAFEATMRVLQVADELLEGLIRQV
ncbi:MAG: flagellar hook-associated protein FlgK [Polyangiaceae bacterium]|nr:flagellar hook-associated protein FlgK [Polyangiaceae bacterium]